MKDLGAQMHIAVDSIVVEDGNGNGNHAQKQGTPLSPEVASTTA